LARLISDKPSEEDIKSRTIHKNSRSSDASVRPFFLSDALASHLTVYPRCYQLRTSYALNWETADKYGMNDVEVQNIFDNQVVPRNEGPEPERSDPIERGFETNYPLVAFYWICRRFVSAPKYCLNCGTPVKVEGRRPYVCDKPLCLYGMMCLGCARVSR
jgi:ubiquitin-conjugating enzyme E2 Q